ncbi:MAG: Na/Pi cotransporter family protein [Clostridia bacterium]|nr:Na/Pi cotransporter family protein [Clostridia bacterium]
MTLDSILQMLGGIGLFLYGMKLMGNSLEKIAGNKMEATLEKLTNSKPKGVLLGAGVTAVIQSSSATIIMLLGFINAGIMKLAQAVPVILGANIGTTVTAQILRLSSVSGDSIWVSLFKPTTFAPICIVIGAFVLLLSGKMKTKDKAGIAIGLGIIFVGMTMMQEAFLPLTESGTFKGMMLHLNNPVLGLLAGILITVLLQSSSASVGVVQALAVTGAVTYGTMFPIIIGANIGKTVTVILGSVGTNKETKRAVSTDVMSSIFGAVVFLLVIYLGYAFGAFDGIWNESVSSGNIANFHTIFNLVTCILLLPCIDLLVKLACKLIKGGEENPMEKELAMLDPLFIKNPSIALEQSKKVMKKMAQVVRDNFYAACDTIDEYDDKKAEFILENEKFLDKTETVLGEYLVEITAQALDDEQNRLATEMMHTVGDFERIGDHCTNLLEVGQYNHEQNINFSDQAKHEEKYLVDAVKQILDYTVDAYENEKEEICHQIRPLEDTIDYLTETLKSHHVDRLMSGICTTQAGISWIEILTNMERVADHCNNISTHLHQRINHSSLDMHLNKVFDKSAEDYVAMYQYYLRKYCEPFENIE